MGPDTAADTMHLSSDTGGPYLGYRPTALYRARSPSGVPAAEAAPKAAAPGVLWLHAATMSFDAKTQAILSFLQAQATAAPELAGDININLDMV